MENSPTKSIYPGTYQIASKQMYLNGTVSREKKLLFIIWGITLGLIDHKLVWYFSDPAPVSFGVLNCNHVLPQV